MDQPLEDGLSKLGLFEMFEEASSPRVQNEEFE